MSLGNAHAMRWRAGLLAAGISVLSSFGMAAEVSFTGAADGDLKDALEAASLLNEQSSTETEQSTQEVVAAAQADYGRLLAVLYDHGYYGGTITIRLDGRDAADIPPVNPPATVRRAEISIFPGPQFRFGRTSVGPLPQDATPPEAFREGEIARLGVLKATVSTGIDAWRAQGHAKAELAQQDLAANHPQRRLDAALTLRPGPRLRFGPLRVTGNEAVRTERIIEIAGLPTGTVYSPEELALASARLQRTGTFRSAALTEADSIGPGNTLPIDAQITEAKPRRFGFGAELSSLEGLTLNAFWLHRNLLGGAERLRIEGEVKGIGGDSGGEDYRLSVRFDRPATFNEDTDFYALASVEQNDEVSYFSREVRVESGITRYASKERTYALGLGLERAETRDAFGTNRYTLLTLPLAATFDYRDNRLDAKDGYYLNANVTPFLALSGSDNGVRSLIDLRGYRTFGTNRPVTLALRGQLGSVFGPDLSVAPADYLFYSGGGGTVRGQPYQALGVNLSDGQTTGGRSFVGLSAELRIQATDSIGLVAFADAGYIGQEEFYDGSGEWHSGAGLGLRYATGIGPIRLDLAVPTSGPDTGENLQVYIGIGQSF